jgi:hypothetical protein
MEFIDRPKKGLPVVQQNFLSKEQYELMKTKLKENNDIRLYCFAMFAVSTMARITAIPAISLEQNNNWDSIMAALSKPCNHKNLVFPNNIPTA